ncbi:MAG: response regulator [Verrucomicrobia bacterium]|nr:response regulator [Verrucomicrobiota bacterium]
MKILIADDDRTSRCVLEAMLTQWRYRVVAVGNGAEAVKALHAPDAPLLAILDWEMPEMDGVEACRRLRASPPSGRMPHLILLTSRHSQEDLVAAMEAGADDYLTKPVAREELRVRVQAGARMVSLQCSLAERVAELEQALEHIKTLQGILPICMYCKKIRDDREYWHQLESYMHVHTNVQFSHGICPECVERHVKPQLEAAAREAKAASGGNGRAAAPAH